MKDEIDQLVATQRAAWGRKARPARTPRKPRGSAAESTPLCECPSWVPGHLVKEWTKVAKAKDEFAAAAHIRNLKKGRKP